MDNTYLFLNFKQTLLELDSLEKRTRSKTSMPVLIGEEHAILGVQEGGKKGSKAEKEGKLDKLLC